MFSHQFKSVADGIVTFPCTPLVSPPKQTSNVPTVTPNPCPSPPAAVDAEFQKIFQHNIVNTRLPKNVTAIYDEYYGLGAYLNVPIEGGLHGLEVKYGKNWRQGNAAYQKAFSQVQLIVKCVDQQITEEKDQATVLEEMDKLFVEKNCKTCFGGGRFVAQSEGAISWLWTAAHHTGCIFIFSLLP